MPLFLSESPFFVSELPPECSPVKIRVGLLRNSRRPGAANPQKGPQAGFYQKTAGTSKMGRH
jgi:hypothetical protein